MKSVCLGLIFVFFCDNPQSATVSDFCQLTQVEVAKLKSLSEAEIAALSRPRKEAIVSLRRKYARLCEVK